MKNRYLIIFCIAAGALSSCREASFDAVIPPYESEYWFVGTPSGPPIQGNIFLKDGGGGGGNQPLPAGASVVIGWEIPNSSPRAFFLYGGGLINRTMVMGKEYDDYTIRLHDSLPKFVLMNGDTTNAIAAGHILLLDNNSRHDGDTLTLGMNQDWKNTHILGGLEKIGMIFMRGDVSVGGRTGTAMPAGYYFLRSRRENSMNTVVESELALGPLDIHVDDDQHNNSPMWLP
ncbi:MAG: hypothetical protein WCH46_00275 [bacterium]